MLKGINRLVFRSVVHEDAIDVVHACHKADVTREDTKPDHHIHEAKLPRCPVCRIADGFDEQLREDFE